jgi:hypothetical protein
MEKAKTYLRSADLIAQVPSARLHFGKTSSHKIVIGGICTTVAALFFIWLSIHQGMNIYTRRTPFTKSFEGPVEYKKMPLKAGSRLILNIENLLG